MFLLVGNAGFVSSAVVRPSWPTVSTVTKANMLSSTKRSFDGAGCRTEQDHASVV